jgi:hypothetical protein
MVPAGTARDPNAPKGSRAAFMVLEEGPPSGMTLEEIFEAYARRGWLPETNEPTNAIRAALNRLRKGSSVTLDSTSKRYRITLPDELSDSEYAEMHEDQRLDQAVLAAEEARQRSLAEDHEVDR